MQTVKNCGLLLLGLVSAFGASGAQAQSFPAKPIHIHTSGAGGGTDFVSRLLANELGGLIGQSVVVENFPSASIMSAGVAKSAPDGYTLMLIGPGMWVGPLFEQVSYDPVRDFAPVVTATRAPSILVVTAGLPAKTVADLIKLAKARPGELNYSTGASGGSPHLAAALFTSMANTDIQRIAYKGGAAELGDLITGAVQMSFGSAATWSGQINSGKVRALATTGPRRSALFPDLPTIGETVPGYQFEVLFGIFAPAKTPEAVVRRLNQDIGRALEKPDMRDRLLKSGQEPGGGSPEALGDAIKAEIAKTAKLVKDGVLKAGS